MAQKYARNALGTSSWRGGLTWVGEEGPELVELPAGAKIYDNRRSMQMIHQQSSGDTYNVVVNVKADNFRKIDDVVKLFEQMKQSNRAGAVMA